MSVVRYVAQHERDMQKIIHNSYLMQQQQKVNEEGKKWSRLSAIISLEIHSKLFLFVSHDPDEK